MAYLAPSMSPEELEKLNHLALAHVGDGVYELLVRTWLCLHQGHSNRDLHRETVARVCAGAQSAAVGRIEGLLTEEEHTVYRQARNTAVGGIPRNATPGEYHRATGLEALFGWLWLTDRRGRIEELFACIMEGEPIGEDA